MKKLLFTNGRILAKAGLFCIVIASAAKQSRSQNLNLTLASHLSYGTEALSNIWGWKSPVDGKEYALVGAANGLSIVDVSIPATPVPIVQIPVPVTSQGCAWREVKTWGNYAYVTTECGTMGLQIVDLTNLPSPSLATATWTPVIGTDTLKTIHALHIDNGKLYLYGGNLQGCLIADVSTTPMSPVYLGSYNSGGYIHDGYVGNDTMYAGHIWAGTVEIVNLSIPASGIPLASFQTPHVFTHNTWLSADHKTCFATDEVDGAYLSAFDITNLGNISLIDTIQSNPGSGSIVHNTYIITKNSSDYAVTSWYKDGITVVDAARPANLVQVGNYDTSPLSGGGYGGCWGVYPYLPSGTIVVSDIDSGLYVLAPTYVRACYIEGTVDDCSTGNPVSGVTVQIQNPGPSTGSATDLTDALGQYGVGVLTAGTYTVTVSKTGYLTQTFTVAVTSGNVTTLNVQLCVTGIKESAYNNPDVSVYPNPFAETATLRITNGKATNPPAGRAGYEFKLYDLYSREVKNESIRNSEKFVIRRDNLPVGMYFYKITADEKIIGTGKVVIE